MLVLSFGVSWLIIPSDMVNLIFYFGKIWKGQATKRNIDTVIALSLIPEILKFVNLTLRFAFQEDFGIIHINYTLTIICAIISIRILIIGLARVQKFGYGISVLNLFLPQLIIAILYYSIRS